MTAPPKNIPTPLTDVFESAATFVDHERDAYVVQLLDFVRGLERKLSSAKAVNNSAVCAYCGWTGPKTPEGIFAHLETCEQHPLKLAIELNAALRSQLARAREGLEWIAKSSDENAAEVRVARQTLEKCQPNYFPT